MSDLIDRKALIEDTEATIRFSVGASPSPEVKGAQKVIERINKAPAVDAVEVSQIKAYLQGKLDEWNALGDRKFEPANMWGYNFIMACFDDLAAYGERKGNG